MDADYSFHVKTIETYVRTFLALDISAIGRVLTVVWQSHLPIKFIAAAILESECERS